MRRPLLLALTLLSLLPAAADAAAGRFFGGEVLDGATGDVIRLLDVDVARDGNGAVAYLRRDGGEPHVFVSRFTGGALQPPERVDAAIAGPANGASVAVADGGRLVVAFDTGGAIHVVVKPNGQAAALPPQLIAASGSDPSVSMSVGGHAYVVFRSGGDLRAARMDRRAQQFTGLPDPLDIDQARDAGANGLPRVATSADGTALAVWGEGGAVFARRLFGLNVSKAPQQLAAQGEAPDVGVEDDSSYAWAVFRAADGTYAARQRGSSFDAPVRIDNAGDAGAGPRIAVSGRGEGYAASTGSSTGQVLGAVLKDDKFFAPQGIGASFGGNGAPAPAVAENGDGVIAYVTNEGTVKARAYDNNPRSRLATPPGPEQPLSDVTLGTADPTAGVDADANRAGDVLVAWTQADGQGGRRLLAGTFDRAPGAFVGTTSPKWRPSLRPELRWQRSFELWGPVTYRLEIDGQPVGETQATNLVPSVDIADGVHTWAVVATDRRGQVTRSRTRSLRVDSTPPTLELAVKRAKKMATVTATVTDDPGTGAQASGLAFVRFQVGSEPPVTLFKPPFRLKRRATGTVRVSATDDAGNSVVDTRVLSRR